MSRTHEDSLARQIKGLRPGFSVSRTKRLSLDEASGDMSPTEALAKLRNVVNQAVSRARKDEAGSNFRVESAVGMTDDKQAILCTVAATRLAGEPDGDVDDI